jgi:hypothetical protein
VGAALVLAPVCPGAAGALIWGLRSPQILCPNLIEFEQVVVSEYL